MMEKKSESQKPTILVVGDLFIDENWLMAKNDNYHSTNVGDLHYISLLKGPNSLILSLCGIGNVMKILGARTDIISAEVTPDKNKILEEYKLVGIGAWNPRDQELLGCILCPMGSDAKILTPYTLSGLKAPKNLDSGEIKCPYRDSHECINPPDIRNLVKKYDRDGSKSSTNRIFRIYEGFGGDQPKLLFRYDWKMEIEEKLLDLEIMEGFENVKAIIIVDHGKGVITSKLVEKLCDAYPAAKWYVRLKLHSPDWMYRLKEKNQKLRLLVKDEQLIKYEYGIRRWRHSTRLGRGALEILGDMLGLATYLHNQKKEPEMPIADNAAVLFEDDSAIAGSRLGEDDASLMYIPQPQEEKKAIEVGRTSVFFNSLIYWDLVQTLEDPDLSLDTLYIASNWALNNMYRWTEECTRAWITKETSGLSGPFNEVITWEKPEMNNGQAQPSERYLQAWTAWNESSDGQGILSNNELQFWRSFGILPNYICPGGTKRSAINRLLRSLHDYKKQKNPRSPFNFLFLAEPGWGKSYLAECISEHFDFEYLEYSIAQMSSPGDLIDSLKVVLSTQKRTENRVLVFVDEIDAEIEGSSVLDLLLSPMWDGTFKIEGNTNKIDPCVWVFASTKPVGELRKEIKGLDFISRINGQIINVDHLTEGQRMNIHNPGSGINREELLNQTLKKNSELKTELVYQGVNLLNKMFGPIIEIDKEVLELFSLIRPINGIRSLGIFVSRFTDINMGRVIRSNVPHFNPYDSIEDELGRHIRLLDVNYYNENFVGPQRLKKGSPIKIFFRPPY